MSISGLMSEMGISLDGILSVLQHKKQQGEKPVVIQFSSFKLFGIPVEFSNKLLGRRFKIIYEKMSDVEIQYNKDFKAWSDPYREKFSDELMTPEIEDMLWDMWNEMNNKKEMVK